jgi:cell wall-associated NlpC family hydrolase
MGALTLCRLAALLLVAIFVAAGCAVRAPVALEPGPVTVKSKLPALGYSMSGEGFDCSGLTTTVYQLNGLNLPRTSAEQFRVGMPVGGEGLHRGDLVFFAISGGRRVSHVGIYTGEGRFIHAPGRGKAVREDLLSEAYYKARYVGGRRYL